jgi:hypothetical protein
MYGALGKKRIQIKLRIPIKMGSLPKRLEIVLVTNAINSGIQLKKRFQSIEKSTALLN